MSSTGKLDKFLYWGNDDVTFDLGLEEFGVDLSEIYFPVDTKQKFRCCIEDWQLKLVKQNDYIAELDIFEK